MDIRDLSLDTVVAFVDPKADVSYQCTTAQVLLNSLQTGYYEFDSEDDVADFKVYIAKSRAPRLDSDDLINLLDGCEGAPPDCEDIGKGIWDCVSAELATAMTRYLKEQVADLGIWYEPDLTKPVDVLAVIPKFMK